MTGQPDELRMGYVPTYYPGAPTLGAALPAGGAFRPRAPGQFEFPRLLPGRYFVVAIESSTGNTMPRVDEDVLAALRGKAIAVTVVPGESAVADLRLVKQ